MHNIKNKEYWKVILLIIILCIVTILVALKMWRYFMVKDFTTRKVSFIWAERKYSEEGCETMLYQYGPNNEEVLLENRYEFRDFICSEDNETLLSFIGSMENFIISEYDICSRQLNRILDLEEIDSFLDENGYEKFITQREGSCVRYYDNENKISFIYDKYIMGYSEEGGLEIIYTMQSSVGREYSWLERDSVLLVSDTNNLVKYNTVTKEKEILIEGARTFNLSEDEKFVVFQNNKKEILQYELKSGKTKKLHTSNQYYPILRISRDNRYLLYENFVRDFLGENIYFIYIIDIKGGENVRIKKWGHDTRITGVAWRYNHL